MASRNLGTLTLDLVAKIGGFTQSMDRAAQVVDSRMKSIQNSADRAKKALTSIFAVAVGGYTLKGLADMADQYGQMAARIKMVTSSTEEYNKVQERLLATANTTYRPLQEAQELYIRSADSIKTLGYNTQQALDITDSFSYLLVTNAASADRANTAIGALSKVIQTGKVDTKSWQTILTTTPSIVETLAQSTGKAASAIRTLGLQGKLSLEDLLEGLRKTADSNKKLAENMDTTINDALVKLKNNIQAFVGQQNSAYGVTAKFAQVIGTLADNIELLAGGAFVLLAGKAGAMAATLAASTVATANNIKVSIQNAAAKRNEALATVQATQATLENLAAEKSFTLFSQQSLLTQLRLAQTEAARNSIRQQLKTNAAQLVAITNAETAATTRLVAAQTAAAGIGRTLIGVLGGPVGIGLTVASVAASWLLFRDNTNQAKQALIDINLSLEETKQKLADLTTEQVRNNNYSLERQLLDEQKKLESAVDSTTALLSKWSYNVEHNFRPGHFTQQQVEEMQTAFANIQLAIRNNGGKGADEWIQLLNRYGEGGEAFARRLTRSVSDIQKVAESIDGIQARIGLGLNAINDKNGINSNDKPKLNFPTGTSGNSILNDYQNKLRELQRDLTTYNDKSKLTALNYDLQNGKLKNLTQTQKQALQGLASEIDLRNAVAEAAKKQREQQEYLSALTEQVLAKQKELSIDTFTSGMGQKQAEEYRQLIAIQEEYAKKQAELAKDLGKDNGLSLNDYNARINALRQAQQAEIAIVVDAQKRKREAEENWLNGIKSSFQDYVYEGRNAAKQVGSAVTSAFSRMEDSVVKFVTTGKFSFNDFARSILEDIARIGVRIASSNILMGLFGSFFGNYAGASAGLDGLMSSPGGLFAKGGAFAGGVQAFAKGGAFSNSVINSPIVFPFAKGGTPSIGIGGEAGPEAIMPLTRTADGNLGVRITGLMDAFNKGMNINSEKPQVNIVINQNGQNTVDSTTGYEQAAQEIYRDVERIVDRRIMYQKKQGGTLNPNNRRNQR